MNLKRVPYIIVNFEQIHTALFRVQKTACASYHCCCCLDSRQCRKVKKREFNQSFQPGKCFHQLCFAPSSFLSLLLPCQVQDGQEKTKNKVLPKLYASLTIIASCHRMLYHILGGSFSSMQVLTICIIFDFWFLGLIILDSEAYLGIWNKTEDFAY